MNRHLRNTGIAVLIVCTASVFYLSNHALAPPLSSQPAVKAPVSDAQNNSQDIRSISLDGQVIRIAVASSPSERELGLGGRPGLEPDEGLLFVFPNDGEYAFWMKGMRFPIDIIWIAVNARIVDIAQNLSPATFPDSFSPRAPARYVLELPAGYTIEHNVKIGDMIQL